MNESRSVGNWPRVAGRLLSILTAFALLGMLMISCADEGQVQGGQTQAGGETQPAEPSNTLERARADGFARVAFANEPPLAYIDPESGELTGATIEVARAILAELGIEAQDSILTGWDAMIPGVLSDRFDLVAAGLYVTPERCEVVAFAEPDMCFGNSFAVAAGNPLDIANYDDIAANPGIRLGLLAGVVEHDYAEQAGVDPKQIQVFPDTLTMLEALKADRIDAVGYTSIQLARYLDQFGDPAIEMVPTFYMLDENGQPMKQCGAVAFRPDDTEFVEAWNGVLEEMKSDGRLEEILTKFGFDEGGLPTDITTEELCKAPSA